MYINITDTKGRPLLDAKATVTDANKAKVKGLRYDKRYHWFEVENINPGTYVLSVSCKGYQAESKTVTIGESDASRIDIVLGKTGSRFLRVPGGRLAFENPIEQLQLVRKPGRIADGIKAAPAPASALLQGMRTGEGEDSARLDISGLNSTDSHRALKKDIEDSDFEVRGLQVDAGERQYTLYAGVAFAFRRDASDEKIQQLLDGAGFRRTGEPPYVHGENKWIRTVYENLLSNRFVDTINDLYENADINDIVVNMSASDQLLAAPGDDLLGLQWSLALADVPSAWDLLYEKDPLLTYGSADVIVSVFDSGLQVAHPDFNTAVQGGALSARLGGNQKVYGVFDFNTLSPTWVPIHMVPNNNQLFEPHGTRVCGIVAAASGTDAALPGIGIGGNEGVAGIASNARLMSSIFPRFITVDQYTEAYLYLQGFNPNWTIAGYLAGQVFPAAYNGTTNKGPGYSLSNHSHSFGAIPSFASGSRMAVMIDTMASFGRARRGAFMLFAAGNDDTNIFTNMLIGRHEKVIVVAGSSIGPRLFEERSSYSNFGAIVPPAGLNGPQEYAEIDFCAPTNHHVAGTGTTVNGPHYLHFPPINRGVFTADLIGRPLVVDAVGAAGAALGSHTFAVTNAALFNSGDPILIGNIGGTRELHTVYSAGAGTLTVFSALKNAFGAGTRVEASSTADAPYSFTANANINGNPVANQANITVNNIASFATGMAIVIGGTPVYPAVNNCESGYVESVAGNVITLRDVLKYNHFNGEAVRGGNAAMTDAFSGTSAACPFASGVLALVLSANPNLSFWEARDILKRTAIPIDLRLRSATVGQNVAWVDLAGNPLVDANGLLHTVGGAHSITGIGTEATPNASVIHLDNVAGLAPGQAILIGAESTLTALPAANIIVVANASNFAVGQQIEINSGPLTHLATRMPAGFTFVYVGNVNLFVSFR